VARPDPPADLERFVSESIAAAPYACRACVTVDGSADEVAAAVPPWVGVVTAVEGSTCTVTVAAPSWNGVVSQLALIERPFRVTDPPDLLVRLAEIGRRLVAAGDSRTPDEP
jgi:hypothetical protein